MLDMESIISLQQVLSFTARPFLLLAFVSVAALGHYSDSSYPDSAEEHQLANSVEHNDFDTATVLHTRRNCSSSCLVHKDLQQLRLEKIKEHILQELNLEQPPNVTGIKPPKALLDNILSKTGMINVMNDSPNKDFYPSRESVRVPKFATKALITKKYTFAEKVSTKKLPQDPRRSFFNFDTMRNYPVLNATLYAYLNVPRKASSSEEVHTVHMHLYKYVSETEIDATPLHVRTIKEDLRPNGKWEMFNITSTVYEWMKNKERNFGVMLKAEFEEEDVVNRDYEKTKKTMFIEVQVREEHPRTVPERLTKMKDCEEGSFHEECCRYPLMVDFESFGWDWIIAPKRYNAYYCAGKCSPTLNRYLVGYLREQQQLLQEIMGKNLGSIGPCCSPHAMSGMKVIYYNEYKQIIERTIPDMVVERCSCG